jgi:hypothetical protein
MPKSPRGQHHRNKESKYKRQFIRTVKKTGKWRGQKKSELDVK